MLKVFNVSALTQKQRFGNAILYGSLTSLALLLVYVLFYQIIDYEFLYAYMGIGYLIGLVVQKTGRGVQRKFSILAAVLCLLVIVLGDLFTYFPFVLFNQGALLQTFRALLWLYGDLNLSTLLGVGFRVVAIILAWQGARVI